MTPDQIACAHGLVSSTLRDMARFGMLFTSSWKKAATEEVVSDPILERIRTVTRPLSFFLDGFDGPHFSKHLGEVPLGNNRQWDAIFKGDRDMFKSGFMGQGLYVSPSRDLVICFFSTNSDNGASMQRFLRPIATAPMFAD